MLQCKYCKTQTVTWTRSDSLRWHMVNEDGSAHVCFKPKAQPKRLTLLQASVLKVKPHRAYLKWYGPRSGRIEALFVEAYGDPDTPAGFYFEPTRSDCLTRLKAHGYKLKEQ